jgi:hypothetical protein
MGDEDLLHRFRLCRADLIAALGASGTPPTPRMLRELADLQLAIMATEEAILDKSQANFECDYRLTGRRERPVLFAEFAS